MSSHDAHGAHDHGSHGPDINYPPGRLGLGRGALLFLLVAILLSIMQGSFVAGSSAWGRVWPSINSTHLDLPPKTF